MYRNELKFIIDPNTAQIISRRMASCCGFDENADEEGFYRVSSLYFDDFMSSALKDNLIGQMDRKKYRVRIYDGRDDFIKLEKKIRRNQVGEKQSCTLTKAQYDWLIRGEYEKLKASATDPLLESFCVEARLRGMKPKVIVEYDRRTFVYSYGDVRITMDHNIRYVIGGVDMFSGTKIYAPAVESGQIVLEVKFTGFLPDHIRSVLQQGGPPRQSLSKYALCRMRSH